MTSLPIAPIRRIARQHSERVSEDAVVKLSEIIETLADIICEDASKITSRTGKKTLSKEDIDTALSVNGLKSYI